MLFVTIYYYCFGCVFYLSFAITVWSPVVELTKKYGADEDYQFVNGLLGAVARDHGLDAEQAEQ